MDMIVSDQQAEAAHKIFQTFEKEGQAGDDDHGYCLSDSTDTEDECSF